jgi:hypothetical protein
MGVMNMQDAPLSIRVRF